eukprot:5531091-Pleurochrysis_carterae.AAC.1
MHFARSSLTPPLLLSRLARPTPHPSLNARARPLRVTAAARAPSPWPPARRESRPTPCTCPPAHRRPNQATIADMWQRVPQLATRRAEAPKYDGMRAGAP